MVLDEIVGTASSLLTWHSIFLFSIFFILVYVFMDCGKPRDFPPGPPILPLIGSIPFTGAPSSQTFFKMREEYGKIFGFGMFHKKVVVITDSVAIKEAMHNTASVGRPPIILIKLRNRVLSHQDDNIGILGTWGPNWQEQRRFVLKNLRDLGFGKTSHEPLMHEEMLELMDYIEKQEGQPIPMQMLFNRTIINILWAMVMGKRYTYNNPEFQDIIATFDQLFRSLNPVSPVSLIPGFLRIGQFLGISWIKEAEQSFEKIIGFLMRELGDLQRAYEEGERADHLVGTYLAAIEKNKGKEASFHFTQLKAVVVELFFAGSETTSSTLTLAIVLMMEYPEVQTRIQKELDAVVGRGNIPSFEHMDELPYTQAAIHEVQRFISLIPVSLPHVALQDFTVQGFKIPKGAIIFPHLESSNKDPRLWKFPDTFNPNNFLDKEGKFEKNESLMPFGNGRRQCVGEPLARLELFLVLACLLHKFTFTLDSITYLPSSNALFNQPPACSVYARKRF